MAFHWLDSLAEAFLPEAAPNRHTTTIEEDQKRFWHAMQKEYIDDIGEIAEKYPQTYMTWQSRDGSPLKTAQAWGCFESFVELMSLGANKNEDYGGGWTPLLTALARGDKLFIDYIVENKPNLDVIAHDEKGHSYTALQLAIDNRDAESVRLLIERGANAKLGIETKDGEKMTPADYARSKHQPKVAEMLDLAQEIRTLYTRKFVPFLDQQMQMPAAAAPAPAPAPAPAA